MGRSMEGGSSPKNRSVLEPWKKGSTSIALQCVLLLTSVLTDCLLSKSLLKIKYIFKIEQESILYVAVQPQNQ